MEEIIQRELLEPFQTCWIPPWTGSVYDWCRNNCELPNAYAIMGKFDVSISKYLVQPFDDLLNNKVRQINLYAATQTGKTLISELFLPYIICNDPGPTMKLHQTQEMAKIFTETRLIPLLEKCKPVQVMLSHDRFAAKKKSITLPHMNVVIDGAKESVLHGLSIRYLELDEAHLYDKDVITLAKARTTAFAHNRKILITSQPGIEGDHLSKENTGIEYEWSWKCPCCNQYQPYYWSKEKDDGTWAGFVWDKVLITGSQQYDYERTGATTKLQCYYCTGSIHDTPSEREYLNSTGKFIQIDDHGDPAVHTYRWNAFVNQRISFKEKTIQYLMAKDVHKQTGTLDALQIFTQQVLGKEWKRATVVDVSKVLTAAFNPDEVWKEEIFRCMAVDYQQKLGVKYYVITAWSRDEVRVLDHGFVLKWDDIFEIKKKWKIPAPAVFIDSGYNADEVYKESVHRLEPVKIGGKILGFGYCCLKGDGQHTDYPHKDGTRLLLS